MRERARAGTSFRRFTLILPFMGFVLSCAGGTYEVRVQVQPRSLLESAALVEVGVVPNCEATAVSGLISGDPLLRYTPDDEPPALGDVPEGMHGLVARLVDDQCRVIAFGCVTIDLAAGGSGVLTVPLTASAGEACAADTTCRAGRCEAPGPDAGPAPDGMALDGVTLDVSTPDVGPDAMLDAGPDVSGPIDVGPDDASCNCPGGTCRGGVCCTGCWQDGNCREGLASDECGMGGGECAMCECPTPSCEAGACGVSPFRSVDMGSSHACFVTAGNALFCAGRNNSAQLGIGTTSVRELTPQRVPGAWLSVAVGAQHTCAINMANELLCWGQSERGQAGQDGGVVMTPTMVVTGAFSDLRINSAKGNSFARRMDGVWFGFGTNEGGAIDPVNVPAIRVPTPILTVDGDWTEVSAGVTHTCGVTTGGAIYCWGDNRRGQFGTANTSDTGPTAVTVSGWAGVFAGFDATCVLRDDGLIRCSGFNNNRVLGYGMSGDVATSFADADYPGVTTGSIVGDHSQICAVGIASEVVCWGSNQFGQLGLGHTMFASRPLRAAHFDNTVFDLSRAAGYGFFDGENRVWGRNDFDEALPYIGQGRLGLGNLDDVVVPTPLCLPDR